MKYIKTFENKTINKDIVYLAKKQSSYSGSASRKYRRKLGWTDSRKFRL